MCKTHYMRSTRGVPLDRPVQAKSFTTKRGEPLRFIEEVALKSDTENCLLWPFGRTEAGYAGHVTVDDEFRSVTRLICERAHGAPPDPSYEAAFTCANGKGGCVNPRHLVWRTIQENVDVRVAEGRVAKGTRFPQAKLDENKVRAIRRSYPSTSAKELGKVYGVCESTVFSIIKRRKWAWVS